MSGEDKPVHIMGVVQLLTRAFSNLLTNAVFHNPPDTAIQVSIQKNDMGEIKINDNGKGMNEHTVSRLFDRYYRGTSTETPAGGTGLGMAIVKQIVTAHQGTIEVLSKVGREPHS